MARRLGRPARLFLALVVVGFVAVRQCNDAPPTPSPAPDPPDAAASQQAASDGEAAILDAFERRLSNQWVESAGVVDRVLADDNDGSRHQRFILRLSSGHTVLISHNIDLAPRLDGLERGDAVRFSGEYEWNAQGGVVHWTHHDPDGRRDGGWLEFGGRRYQ